MSPNRYTPDDPGSAASKFGQMIGEAFERTVIGLINSYLQENHADYEILAPETGKKLITLQTLGGTNRQLDTVIVRRESKDPVALLEAKWLKDARHHNDKGAWILQLREVRKQYATVRGAAAILAGYWTEGVGIMLASNAAIKMVLVATDSEVYSTLQPYLDNYLADTTFTLDAVIMRLRYPQPHHLANLLLDLEEQHILDTLAESWLNFERGQDETGESITGSEKIKQAIDDLLSPLPPAPRIAKFEIALQIDTGNTIYQEFEDIESAMDFLQKYAGDAQTILNRISPGKKQDKST